MNGALDKPADTATGPASHAPLGSGEGADTALQALIKKRKLRAEDDPPSTADLRDQESSNP